MEHEEQMIETLLLTTPHISTFNEQSLLTNATGFFFEREARLYLVTSHHVLFGKASKHFPTRIEIELHTNPANIAEATNFSIPLYRDGKRLWCQGLDASGEIDVGVIEIDRKALPAKALYRAFNPGHLLSNLDQVEVGSSLLIVGFPLGFHDALHHTPVVRQAIIASSFGLRFQGKGFFLTDARTHRGSSGAPVVMRIAEPHQAHGDLPWMLLGIHSSRFDIGDRDRVKDEALGLNGAWYADILLKLTEEQKPGFSEV